MQVACGSLGCDEVSEGGASPIRIYNNLIISFNTNCFTIIYYIIKSWKNILVPKSSNILASKTESNFF